MFWSVRWCTVSYKPFYIERGLYSKMKEGERGTRKRTACMWRANSCKAIPPPLPSADAIRGSQLASTPPPLPHPHTPHCWILTVFSDLGQNRGRPPFRSLKVLQLNLDSNCDYVRIFGVVIGHLEAEIDFWIFHRKWWKSRRAQRIWQSAKVLTSRAGTTAGTVRERRRPYKLGGLSPQIIWDLHAREATSLERELFSQTWRKSALGDSAEPK